MTRSEKKKKLWLLLLAVFISFAGVFRCHVVIQEKIRIMSERFRYAVSSSGAELVRLRDEYEGTASLLAHTEHIEAMRAGGEAARLHHAEHVREQIARSLARDRRVADICLWLDDLDMVITRDHVFRRTADFSAVSRTDISQLMNTRRSMGRSSYLLLSPEILRNAEDISHFQNHLLISYSFPQYAGDRADGEVIFMFRDSAADRMLLNYSPEAANLYLRTDDALYALREERRFPGRGQMEEWFSRVRPDPSSRYQLKEYDGHSYLIGLNNLLEDVQLLVAEEASAIPEAYAYTRLCLLAFSGAGVLSLIMLLWTLTRKPKEEEKGVKPDLSRMAVSVGLINENLLKERERTEALARDLASLRSEIDERAAETKEAAALAEEAVRATAELREEEQAREQLREQTREHLREQQREQSAVPEVKTEGSPTAAERAAAGSDEESGQITNYILQHLTDPGLSAKSIAEALHYSEKYVYKLLRDSQGVTLNRYIQSLRLEEARRLLLGTELAIADIAERCGFASYNSFYKSFIKSFDLTPSRLRQQNAE